MFTVPADAGSPAANDRLLHQRQRARAASMTGPKRRRCSSDSPATPTDNLESVAAYTDDDGALPARGRRTGAGGPLVRRAVRLHLRRPHAARNPRPRRTSRTSPRFCHENGFDAIQGVGGYVNQLGRRPHRVLAPHVGLRAAGAGQGKRSAALEPVDADAADCRTPPASSRSRGCRGCRPATRRCNSRSTTRSTTSARCSTPCRSTKTPGRIRSKAGRTIRTARKVDVRKEFIANMGKRITLVDRLRHADHGRQRALAVCHRGQE